MLENLSVTTASLALAFGISLVALSLVLWLRLERSLRDEEMSEADRIHFSRQDVRRNAGLAILFLLAQGIAISPRLDPRARGRPNILFLLLWLAIFILLLVLLFLAFFDMAATRLYAKRHRDAILRERTDLLGQLEQLAHRQRTSDEASSTDPDSANG